MTEPGRRMDGYGPEDMAIPSWVLLQKTGGDWPKQLGGQPGQFHNTGSDEIIDELNIIVVDILTGRARWSEEISDAGPLCASLDAKGGVSVNGDDCSQCPFRLDTPWSSDATERRKMCCLNYTILGITLNDLIPCIIRAHGISALPVRQLITQLRLNRSIKGEYYKAAINIKSQEKTGKYGTAYALHPRVVELITDEPKVLALKAESNRLLGTPIPLPEGRPEEEPEPLGFTPEGIPFYSEAEKDRLLIEEKAKAEAPPAEEPPAEEPPAKAEPATPAEEKKVAPPPAPPEEEKKKTEASGKKLDLDF